MNDKEYRITDVILRPVTWMAFVVLQIMVSGKSINISYGTEPFDERSVIAAVAWAVVLPVVLAFSLVPPRWRYQCETMTKLGEVYPLVGGAIIVAFTLLLHQG